ncbi:MAG TPA: alpha/beta hydrolase, partial [Verrucomicrobiae bacterium]|nr:alpha/beta hydrolase [Verrucomicrobiae bacterium]
GVEYLRAVSVDVQGARRPALQLRFSAADTEDEVRRLFSSKAPARYAEAQALTGGFVTLPPESEPSNPEDLTRRMEQAGNGAQSVRLVSKNFTDGLWEAKYEISFAAPEGPQKIIYVLNYPESPEPLPVGLVLHGWQVSKDEPFVAELAKAVARQGYAVVRPDFRNHHGKMWNEQARVMDDNRNESSGEIADFKWGQSLEDVSRVAAALQAGTDLPRLTLEGALLFGYSYGGWTARTVAQAAARQTGGFNGLKVRAVFDFASPADPTASLFSIVKGRMVSQGLTSGAAFDKARELMDAWYQKPAAGGAWQGGLPWFLSASRPHNPIFERPFLRQVAHYYFIGQKDTILFGLQPMTDLVNAAAGRAVLSGAESRLTVIKGMGHFFTPEYRPAVVANVAGIAQRLRMSSAIPFSSSFPVQVLDLSKAPKPRPLKRGFDRLFPLHASARTRKLTAAALLEILRRHGLNQEHLGSDAKGFYVTVEKSIGGHVRQLSAVQADIEREYPGAYRFDTIPVLDRGDYQLQILRGSKKKSELRVQPGTFKLFHENKSAGVSYKILAEWQKDHDDPNSMFYILEKSGTHKRFVLKAFPESREWKLGGRFSGANLVSYEKVTDESGHRMLLSPLVPRSKLAESPGLAAKPHEAYLPQEVDDFIVTIDEKWGRSDPRYIDAWIRLLADSLAAQRQLTDAGFYFDDSFFPNLWVTDGARGHVRAMLGDADGVASLSAVPRKILADDYVFSIMIEEWAGFFLAHAGTDARFAPFKELLEQVDFSAVKTGAQLKRRLTAFETEVRRAAGFALKIKNRVELRGVDGEANGQVEMGTVWRVYHRQLLITRLRKEMAAGRLRELTVNGESILRNGEGVRPGLDRAFVASYVVRQMPMDHFPFEYEWRNEGASLAIRRKPAAAWHFSGEEPPSRTELRSLEDVNPWNDAKEWDYIPGESGWDARKRRDAYLAKKEPLVRRHLEVLNGVEGAEKQIEKWLQVHGSTREWGFFLARRKDTGALRVIMDLMGTGTGAGAGPYGLGEYFPNQVLSYYMALRLLETGTQGEALEEIVAEGHTHIFSPGGIPFSPGDYGQNRYTSSSLVYMTGAPRPFFELAPVEIHDTALIARLEREGWQENRMWYGGGTSHYHVPSGDYLRHFMRNFEAAHFAVKSELRKVEAPRKAGRPGFEDKRIFVDYNDMAAHFSDAQIKEILFTAGEKHRSFLIVVYGVDVTQTLGNFLAGLKLPSLRATAADLPAAAREFTRGFAGERLHLSSAAGEISPQALAAALDENGKNRANLYALAYRDGEGGTLGVALKDLDRRLLAEYTEAGLLKKQLPDYMGFDEKGRIIVTDLRAAGAEAWQSAYESAIAFSRAA